MANTNRILRLEENIVGGCDCGFKCCACCNNEITCDYDCGSHSYGVIIRNVVNIAMAIIFILEVVAGAFFYSTDIYTNIQNYNNGTLCNIDNYYIFNAQQLLILTGLSGLLTLVGLLIHFNCDIYYQDNIKTIKAASFMYYISLFCLFTFNIISLIFQFSICVAFSIKSITIIYIVSQIYNNITIFTLLLASFYERIVITPKKARQLLLPK